MKTFLKISTKNENTDELKVPLLGEHRIEQAKGKLTLKAPESKVGNSSEKAARSVTQSVPESQNPFGGIKSSATASSNVSEADRKSHNEIDTSKRQGILSSTAKRKQAQTKVHNKLQDAIKWIEDSDNKQLILNIATQAHSISTTSIINFAVKEIASLAIDKLGIPEQQKNNIVSAIDIVQTIISGPENAALITSKVSSAVIEGITSVCKKNSHVVEEFIKQNAFVVEATKKIISNLPAIAIHAATGNIAGVASEVIAAGVILTTVATIKITSASLTLLSKAVELSPEDKEATKGLLANEG